MENTVRSAAPEVNLDSLRKGRYPLRLPELFLETA